MNRKSTSWGSVAGWYQKFLEGEGTYQKDVILPNLSRRLGIKKGTRILDLACGPGFFANEFQKSGAKVIGADISPEFIKIARENSPKTIQYEIAPAHRLDFLADATVDKITLVFAIQNIENYQEVFKECSRVLQNSGSLLLVMNHPAFRIPKASEWGWDTEKKTQYRRIDGYLSDSKEKIQMSPGDRPSEYTISFHRPLQAYFKALSKAGLVVTGLEEWISNKKSEPGPRAIAENKSRHEIPLFLFLEATKCGF